MKFAKLSLAAIAAMGITTSGMALDLTKSLSNVSVKTKLYYETVDHDYPNAPDLFDQDASSGQALVQIGTQGNFNSCWGYGVEYSVADTLGLENNLVSNTRMGASPQDGTILDTQDWLSQAYITFRGCGTALDKTTFKIGRQYLDTPLAFTETWNLAPNSFDAIVAMNSDIQNVTVVGAYIGKGNGIFGRVTKGQQFTNYVVDGAYALGLLTNFGVPVNVWYYNVLKIADAWWADTKIDLGPAKLGLQYGNMSPKGSGDDSSGGAVSLSGSVAGFNLMAAYSKMDDDGALALANTATGFKKTKLATAGIYTDGTGVAIPGSKAYKFKVSTKTPIGKLTAQYVSCENDSATNTAFQNGMTNVDEVDLVLGTKVLGINTKLIYINRDVDTAYEIKTPAGGLKHDTQHVRVVLSKNF